MRCGTAAVPPTHASATAGTVNGSCAYPSQVWQTAAHALHPPGRCEAHPPALWHVQAAEFTHVQPCGDALASTQPTAAASHPAHTPAASRRHPRQSRCRSRCCSFDTQSPACCSIKASALGSQARRFWLHEVRSMLSACVHVIRNAACCPCSRPCAAHLNRAPRLALHRLAADSNIPGSSDSSKP